MNKNYVTYGDGKSGCCCNANGSLGITGCRFSIAPMSDNYIDIILGAIKNVDTSKVYAITDKLSTIYRGKQEHVVDAVKSCFINAYKEDVHMVLEATFSKGCPGDTEGESFLAEDDILLNEPSIKDKHFNVTSKISLYPMGTEDYMKHIATVVNHAIDLGIYDHSGHYVTVLEADVQDIFSYINYVLDYCKQNLKHYIFEVTLSVNSPTK